MSFLFTNVYVLQSLKVSTKKGTKESKKINKKSVTKRTGGAMNNCDALEAHYKEVKKALKKQYKDRKRNPTFIQEEYKFSVRLPAQDVVTAEILGQGNRSAGIRLALTGMRHELGIKLVERDN